MHIKPIGVVLAFCLFLLISCQPQLDIAQMNIVENVDFEKYAGKWYEIGRFPHRFEKDLVGVTAEYIINSNGSISVINQGYKNSFDGKLKIAKGRAKKVGTDNKGHLKVSFFLWFYSDYLILELEQENYSYALIGSSSPNYLWILAREPEMEENTYNMLLEKARERGYDISKVEKVLQLK